MQFALQTINFEVPPDHHDSANGISPPQTEGSHQELMQTESENRLLRHRLNTTRDQATGIESSLAEVAQLTELFTQQVMSQSEQIETLYDEVKAEPLLKCARQMTGLGCMWRCCCISGTVHAVPHLSLVYLCLVHKNQALSQYVHKCFRSSRFRSSVILPLFRLR